MQLRHSIHIRARMCVDSMTISINLKIILVSKNNLTVSRTGPHHSYNASISQQCSRKLQNHNWMIFRSAINKRVNLKNKPHWYFVNPLHYVKRENNGLTRTFWNVTFLDSNWLQFHRKSPSGHPAVFENKILRNLQIRTVH